MMMLAGSGRSLLAWIGGVTLWCAVVLLVALVADRLLRGRLRPGLRMALFVAVLVRALLPVDLRSPIGAVPGTTPEIVDALPTTIATATARVEPLIVRGAVDAPAEIDVVGIAVVVTYAAGVLALLALVVAQLLRQRHLCRASAAVVERDGLPSVLVHDEAGPMVVGIRRPRIVVPRGLFHGLAPDLLDAVLRHETAHVRHRDPWSALALAIACAIAWPIVPVWIAAGRIRLLMELRADEAVLDGVTPTTLRAYRKLLLSLAARPMVLAGFAPALGPVTALAARLHAMAERARAPWLVQVVFVVPLALALVGLAARQPDAPASGPEPTGQTVTPTPLASSAVARRSPLPMCRGIVREPSPADDIASEDERRELRPILLAMQSLRSHRTLLATQSLPSQPATEEVALAPPVSLDPEMLEGITVGEFDLLLGLFYAELGEAGPALERFSEAAWRGASLHDDYLTVEGAAGSVVVLARLGGRDDEALSWGRHAEAARWRHPDMLGPLTVEMERSLAEIAARRGALDEAAEHRTRAEVLAERCANGTHDR